MEAPFVQLSLNRITKAVLAGSVRFAPAASDHASPAQWRIVCDADNKVVVRTHDNIVLATATWLQGAVRDPIVRGDREVTREQWAAIEEGVRTARDQAAAAGAEDSSTDDGMVEPGHAPLHAPEPPQESPLITSPAPVTTAAVETYRGWRAVVAYIVLAIVVVVGCIGMYWWVKIRGKHRASNLINGSTCRYDSECASNNCMSKTCRHSGSSPGGAACKYDGECQSGYCKEKRCFTRLDINGRCTRDGDCLSDNCLEKGCWY